MSDLPVDKDTYLFLSDAHLGGFSSEKNKKIEDDLIALIEYCREQQIRIAVLGDLFDYWMEYPDSVPEIGKELLDCFEQYNRKMGGTIYITGNHDNWTKSHFEERGFHVISDQKIVTLDGKRIMLLHGDGLRHEKFNLPRPVMHRLLRNPRFINFYQRLFPPRIGITLMKYFSRLNRALSRESDKQKKLNKWARSELKRSDTDIIVCGHDHTPRVKNFNFGTYINLGTFCNTRTVALYNNKTFSLVSWDRINRELKPFDTVTTE